MWRRVFVAKSKLICLFYPSRNRSGEKVLPFTLIVLPGTLVASTAMVTSTRVSNYCLRVSVRRSAPTLMRDYTRTFDVRDALKDPFQEAAWTGCVAATLVLVDKASSDHVGVGHMV